jgi:hypothetical protein
MVTLILHAYLLGELVVAVSVWAPNVRNFHAASSAELQLQRKLEVTFSSYE